MLQEVHAPIAVGKVDRIGSPIDYGLVYAVYLLLLLGIVAVAVSTNFGQTTYPLDPSTYAIG
jgi:hypothetical protein